MKQFSIVLNLLLLVAVGFLYYLHFWGDKKKKSQGSSSSYACRDSTTWKKPIIAYVELDSLNNNVTFIKERKKELEAEQKLIVAEYESSYHSMESERNEFLKKGNAITQQEAEAFQLKLGQRQQDVEAKKQEQGQKLAEKGARIMSDMQSKLKIFLDEYNKDKKYTYILATGTGLDYVFYKDSTLNITADIIKGMNEKMNEK